MPSASILGNFPGINRSQAGGPTPPDTAMAVGPSMASSTRYPKRVRARFSAVRTISSSSTISTVPPMRAVAVGAGVAGAAGAAGATGINRWMVVPRPGALSMPIAPPCALTARYTVASPRPVASCRGLVVKNGSNTRSTVAASIPWPVSETEKRT